MNDYQPGFYGKLAAAVMDRPRRALLLLALVSLVAGALSLRLRVDPDLIRLLPEHDPATQAIQNLHEKEGGTNFLTIAVKGKEPAAVTAFMPKLKAGLEAMPDVEYVLYDVDPALAWRVGLFSLSPEELSRLRDRLKGALALGPAFQNPFVASQWLDLGQLTEKLKHQEQPLSLVSPDGVARVLVRPKGIATDTTFSRAFMADVYTLLDELDLPAQGLQVAWVGGVYRHTVEDLENIIYDLTWTNIASMILVILLIAVAYRDVRAVVLIFAPLFMANLWQLGFAGATVQVLNTFTSFFSAMLFGLGTDFSVHLYSRYREERVHSDDLRTAVMRAWDKTVPPCATAALTSAGGFAALWVAGFSGFRQLGTLLAGGILLCLVAVVVLLPLLILWREKAPRAAPMGLLLRDRKLSAPPTYRLAPLGLLLSALLIVAAASQLRRVEFEYDISELRRKGLAYRDLSVEEKQLVEESYNPVVVDYPDAASLAADHERLSAKVADGTLPQISKVLSIYSVLPYDQSSRVQILHEIAELARDPNVVYLPPQVQLNLARIASTDIREITPEDLPYSLRHALGAAEGKHRMLMLPAGNMWDLRECDALYEAMKRELPDRPVASEYMAMAVLYRLVQDDGKRVTAVALVLAFIVTLLDVRRLRPAVGTLLTLISGLCVAGAALVLFDIKLSMVNFVGLPILIGIGIDVIIHLLHRLQEEGPGRILRALATTGWAAALTTLANVFGFVSLTFASGQGIRNLGLLITIGLTLATTVAFALVPLGWMTTWKLRGDLPRDLAEPGDSDGK